MGSVEDGAADTVTGTNGGRVTDMERLNHPSSSIGGSNGKISSSSSPSATAGPPPAGKEKAPPLPEPTRAGVTSAFAQFGSLIQASRRPLPTQHGDGTYSETKTRPGLRQDLKSLKKRGMSSSTHTPTHSHPSHPPSLGWKKNTDKSQTFGRSLPSSAARSRVSSWSTTRP